jgi:glycosyltransferase involved in cell wall biosynthesis
MSSVSIILPTYNRVRFLELAVQSVFAQTYTDWEMIIADDGSNEETKAYLRSITAPQVRTIWLPHCGNPSRVRNAAIGAATGRYLAFLDSDDIWAPSNLEKQIGALRERTQARWSYSICDLIDEDGRPLDDGNLRSPVPMDACVAGWIFEPLLRLQVAISMPAIIAERGLVAEIGGFDEEQRFAEWHDLCLRLAMNSEAVALAEPLSSVRIHHQHFSGDRVAEQRGWMQLYEKMGHLAPSPALRAHCVRVRAETSLSIAAFQQNLGEYRAALRTLGKALPFAWHYPRWWWGALKRVSRPAVPRRLASALRPRTRH